MDLLVHQESKFLTPEPGYPFAGNMHRPDHIGGIEWRDASQSQRWGMLREYLPGVDFDSPGVVLDVADRRAVILHTIADRRAYQEGVDAEVVWVRQRSEIYAMKADEHFEGYQRALDTLSADELADYQRWERIWEEIQTEQATEATTPEPALLEQPEPLVTAVEAPRPVVEPRPTRKIFGGLVRRWRLGFALRSLLS